MYVLCNYFSLDILKKNGVVVKGRMPSAMCHSAPTCIERASTGHCCTREPSSDSSCCLVCCRVRRV